VAQRTDLQLLMFVPRDPPMLVGIPAVLRTAFDLALSRAVNRVFLDGESSAFVHRWRARLPLMPWQTLVYDNGLGSVREQLDVMAPLVLVATRGIPDVPSFLGFLDDCQATTQPRTWNLDGAVLAVYYPAAGDLRARLTGESDELFRQAAKLPHARAMSAPREAWQELSDSDGIRRAEARIVRSLRKDSDGYLARLDRSLSIALSRRLVRTPVTPNQVTTLSLALGLLGAALLTSADYWIALLGAVLLWSSCVLDGCDGEVARLKLLASTAGARFDQMADNVVHLATFVGIVVHVHRVHPEFDMRRPGLFLVAGVVLSMALVWWLILRRPDEGRSRLDRILERIASRDYVYLILILVALQRLEWFVWAAAIGANLFWLIVWWASRRYRAA
jgi:phosphatidylglycerophosphate synthase